MAGHAFIAFLSFSSFIVLAPAAPQAQTVADAPTRDPGRTARLARVAAELEAELHAMEKFGRHDEFLAVARAVAKGDTEKWMATRDGWIQSSSLDRYVAWSTPAEGRDKPLAIDVDAPNHSFPVIVDFHRQLAAHGIDLLIVSFPYRAQIYPEILMDLPSFAGFRGMAPAQTRFLLELTRAGVEVVNLCPAFADHRHVADDPKDELFLRANVHWTPRGAELAAKVVADRLRELPSFRPGTAKEGVDFTLHATTFDFRSAEEAGPEGAPDEKVRANAIVPGAGRPEFDIFHEKGHIAVLGGSFVGMHRTHDCAFVQQLCRFTAQSIHGVGARGSIEKASREAFAALPGKEHVRIVVWLLGEPMVRPNKRWVKLPVYDD